MSFQAARLGLRIAQPLLARTLLARMADPAAPLPKRQRLATLASAEPQAQASTAQQAGAAQPAQQQHAEPAAIPAATVTDGKPGQQQPEQQQPGGGGGPGKKAKQLVMPTPVPPPSVPEDPAAWDNAVLLVDKSKDWTSFDVCNKLRGSLAALLRKKSREVKVGHAGTLDPMATGLLIICVGRGTKAVDAFMAMQKEYSGTLRLGEATPSYDAETEVAERLPWERITDEQLLAARDGLLGPIQQLPPMYSAIRVDGKRLYEAARKGKEVERQPRAVTVERFDLRRDERDPQSVHFSVICSKGTYIRSLAHDLGKALGSAAHLTALRREAIGEYRVDNAWDVLQLTEQLTAMRQRRRQEEEEGGQQAAGGGGAAATEAAAQGGGQ